MTRPVIYQLFVRHFSNYSTHGREWGSKRENGCGSFAGVSMTALKKIREMGVTHVWLTGLFRHATQTAYEGIPAQPEAIVKGKAGSPYAVVDYYDVDPDLAENVDHRLEECQALFSRVKEAGMVPVMDFVPNHVSRAYCSQNPRGENFGEGDDPSVFFSRDNSFFYLPSDAPGGGAPLKLPAPGFHGEEVYGRVTGNNAITWAPTAYDWYETVKLNYGYDFTQGASAAFGLPGVDASVDDVPRTWRLMDDILAYWQEMGVGGFRCDMAHMLPMPFWKWALSRAKKRDGDVLFIAEAYDDLMKTTPDDPLPHLLEAGFDAVYDAPVYHLAHAIYEQGKWANDLDVCCHNENPAFMKAVRYIENHDEPRVASPLHWGGRGMDVEKALSTLVFCLSGGAVLMYNGQEVGEKGDGPGGFGGDNGRSSIFDYTFLPALNRWSDMGAFCGFSLDKKEKALRAHYVKLGQILQHPSLVNGQYYGLNWFNRENPDFGKIQSESCAGHWIYAYLRHDFISGATALVVVNLHPDWAFNHMQVRIPLGAFSWMNWEGMHANFKILGEDGVLTDPYTLDELDTRGLAVWLAPGEGKVFEVIP